MRRVKAQAQARLELSAKGKKLLRKRKGSPYKYTSKGDAFRLTKDNFEKVSERLHDVLESGIRLSHSTDMDPDIRVYLRDSIQELIENEIDDLKDILNSINRRR